MAFKSKTFSDDDILRIMTDHLTQIERDTVICTILVATGNIRSGSIREVLGLLRDLFGGKAFDVIKAAAEFVDLIAGGEPRYTPDF